MSNDSRCRFCGEILGQPSVVLANMPLTDDFISIAKQGRREYLADIRIFECRACGFVQNPMDFDHEGYYQDYQYSSGHSAFVKKFMADYAALLCQEFQEFSGRRAESILEVGSGDGEQLKAFRDCGTTQILGVEPSKILAEIAQAEGVPTVVGLFSNSTLEESQSQFDICVSSYTLDHVRNPLEYLQAARRLLVDGGLLAFEVHDFGKIVERTEYCLFEHEHTIYMNAADATRLVRSQGFDIVAINPLPVDVVRGNSLIIVARKLPGAASDSGQPLRGCGHQDELLTLSGRISATVKRIDAWVNSIPSSQRLVGFGGGGRGVMTLAALESSHRFAALFDSNFESNKYLTPKTRIPLVGPDRWGEFADASCLVFSFGYFQEIRGQLRKCGFQSERTHSLLHFLRPEGRQIL